MTEDLIAMGKQCGFQEGWLNLWTANFEQLAALIEARAVARTREECAKAVEDCGWPAWSSGTMLTDVHAAAIRALGERT